MKKKGMITLVILALVVVVVVKMFNKPSTITGNPQDYNLGTLTPVT